MPVHTRARVPQEALDYIRSWSIDPSQILEDGLDRNGYFVIPGAARWEREFRYWPQGFDYDKLLMLMSPWIVTKAHGPLDEITEERIRKLEDRVAELERHIANA